MSRISITLSDRQRYFVEILSGREGVCATAFVYNLVVASIKEGLRDGELKTAEPISDDIIEFVRSLVSDEGVDVENVGRVSAALSIDLNKLKETLGLNDD